MRRFWRRASTDQRMKGQGRHNCTGAWQQSALPGGLPAHVHYETPPRVLPILALGYPKCESATVTLPPAGSTMGPCKGKTYFNEETQQGLLPLSSRVELEKARSTPTSLIRGKTQRPYNWATAFYKVKTDLEMWCNPRLRASEDHIDFQNSKEGALQYGLIWTGQAKILSSVEY